MDPDASSKGSPDTPDRTDDGPPWFGHAAAARRDAVPSRFGCRSRRIELRVAFHPMPWLRPLTHALGLALVGSACAQSPIRTLPVAMNPAFALVGVTPQKYRGERLDIVKSYRLDF